MNERKLAARGIIIHDGKILLVRHPGRDFLALPGGKLDENEYMIPALARELEEEFGVTGAKVGKLVAVNEFIYPGGSYSLECFFEIDNSEIFLGELSGTHSEIELEEIKWVDSLDGVEVMPKEVKPILEEMLKGNLQDCKFISERNKLVAKIKIELE